VPGALPLWLTGTPDARAAARFGTQRLTRAAPPSTAMSQPSPPPLPTCPDPAQQRPRPACSATRRLARARALARRWSAGTRSHTGCQRRGPVRDTVPDPADPAFGRHVAAAAALPTCPDPAQQRPRPACSATRRLARASAPSPAAGLRAPAATQDASAASRLRHTAPDPRDPASSRDTSPSPAPPRPPRCPGAAGRPARHEQAGQHRCPA